MPERKSFRSTASTLKKSLNEIEKLDQQNQDRFRSGPGRPATFGLTADQFYMLTEGLFLHLFRSYERFIEDTFLLSMTGRLNSEIKRLCYVNPKDLSHARELLKGTSRFVEWHSPDIIITRSESYFREGGIVKRVISSRRSGLLEMKQIRDRIAHLSVEADRKYTGVIRTRLLTLPPRIPSPGEFLQTTVRNQQGLYHLQLYCNEITEIGREFGA